MAVAFIISRYPDKDGSNIECSLNTITTKAGISRRTVIEVLDLLIKENLLMRDGKARGGVIRYRMILGGSERVLASTSIPTALRQKDENSTTTNDAVRDSLTLAHTANKKNDPARQLHHNRNLNNHTEPTPSPRPRTTTKRHTKDPRKPSRRRLDTKGRIHRPRNFESQIP